MSRQEQNHTFMAEKRALESPSETVSRQEQTRSYMAMKISVNIPVENTFLSKAQSGPDFVCTCCHRIVYKQNGVPCNKIKVHQGH